MTAEADPYPLRSLPTSQVRTRYTLVDAGLSAFSVFFMQSPSFLEYQRSLEQAHGKNNAQTLFGVHQIPSDNQIRHLLDATEPGRVKPLFSYIFNALNQAGVIEATAGEPDHTPRWNGYFHRTRSSARIARPGNTPTAR
jgi:hypothetical protein